MDRFTFPLSRRTFLRGAGVALALPWLEAMKPARVLWAGDDVAPSPAPVRLAVLFMPNGVHPGAWTPEGEGSDFKFSSILEPLEDFRKDLLVLTNLGHKACRTGDGHYVKTAGLLTGTTITKTVGVDLNCNGVSMDQIAARAAGKLTPLPSLELGTEPVQTGVDTAVGYTRIYGAHIAWSGPTSPLAKEINPRLVYERLFRAGRPGGAAGREDGPRLDLVLEDAKSLRNQLGAGDRQKMDEYLQSVRGLEQRLERAGRQGRDDWKPRAAIDPAARPPEGIPRGHQEHVQLMLDMIALAFQTDTTRVCTFMFGNSVSNKNFAFVEGVKGSHHSLSHHENKPDKMEQYRLIARWHIEQYAYLLRKLAAVREGERSLLDNTMVLFGSDLRDGNRHDPKNLPLVVAGRAGGRLATGQHLRYAGDTPLSDLYVSMLQAFGSPVERFADSTGPLRGVLA
jgi:hypothetical protein